MTILYIKRSDTKQNLVSALEDGLKNDSFTPSALRPVATDTAGKRALSIVADNHRDLANKLTKAIGLLKQSNEVNDSEIYYTDTPVGKERVAFLYPGQGSQYPSMLSAMRQAFPRLNEIFIDKQASFNRMADCQSFKQSETGIVDDFVSDDLCTTQFTQPALGLVSDSLLAFLSELGVSAGFHAGHSYGELVALKASGVIDFPTFVALSVERGRVMQRAADEVPGAMLAINIELSVLENLLSEYQFDLEIANHNSSKQFVVAGKESEIDRMLRLCRANNIGSKRLNTATAFHSKLMSECALDWQILVEEKAFKTINAGKVFTNFSGELCPNSSPDYKRALINQIDSPVRWFDVSRNLAREGATIFVEVGAGKILSQLQRVNTPQLKENIYSTDIASGNVKRQFLNMLAQLATQGLPVKWENVMSETYEDNHNQKSVRTKVNQIQSTAPLVGQKHDSNNLKEVFLSTNADVLNNLFNAQLEMLKQVTLPEVLDDQQGRDQVHDLLKGVVESNKATFETFMQAQMQAMSDMSGHVLTVPESAKSKTSVTPEYQVNSVQLDNENNTTLACNDLDNAGGNRDQFMHWLFDVVADMTGFPKEKITIDSAFESDLGIDSISLMELWAKAIDSFPDYSSFSNQVGDARSIRDVLDMVDTAVPSEAIDQQEVSGADGVSINNKELGWNELRTKIIAILDNKLSELQQNLPVISLDKIDDDADFERDLQINAFVWRAVVEDLHRVDTRFELLGDALNHVSNLSEIRDLMAGMVEPKSLESKSMDRQEGFGNVLRYVKREQPYFNTIDKGDLVRNIILIGQKGPQLDAIKSKFLECVDEVTLILYDKTAWYFEAGGTCLLYDSQMLTNLVEETLNDFRMTEGLAPALVFAPEINSSISILAQPASVWEHHNNMIAKAFFVFCKALNPIKYDATLRFGLLYTEQDELLGRGSVGIAKCLAREWNNVIFRGVCLKAEINQIPSKNLVAQLTKGEPEYHIKLYQDRVSHEVSVRSNELPSLDAPMDLKLDKDDVVMIVGGGTGIGAQVGQWLAERYQCTIVALGRTILPDSDPYPGITSEAKLKARLFQEMSKDGAAVSAKEIVSACNLIRRQREILDTAKQIRQHGAKFEYYRCDVTSLTELSNVVDSVHKNTGEVTALIHGAGVIKDALLDRKNVNEFSQVYDTKVKSTHHLYKLFHDTPLKFVFLFSSLAAHTGNVGQCDYVAANEVLNTVAADWNQSVAYPVKSLLWGAWVETGIMNSSLNHLMTRLGLDGIHNSEGLACLEWELNHGNKNEDWILYSPECLVSFTQGRTSTSKPTDLAEGVW